MPDSTLEVHVVTPEREVWTGEASMIVARALDGDVGILPGHTPLVAVLRVGPMFIESLDSGRISAAIDGGFVHVTSGPDGTRVDVLAEEATLSSEVDGEQIRELEERARQLEEEQEYADARDELAKARTRERLRE
jgi:F-type H+-transporting ATPase subunit epsilon